VLRHRRSLYGLRGLLRTLCLGFFPRVLWHMHSLGVLLFMLLLFLEPAPHMYTYAFPLHALGWFMSLFWFLICFVLFCLFVCLFFEGVLTEAVFENKALRHNAASHV
jgi:cellulose synthase/poly-beta-1,6-N-acetylglucosamine synthase-like glycosyltransferase